MPRKYEGFTSSVDILFLKGGKRVYLDYIEKEYPQFTPSEVMRWAIEDLVKFIEDNDPEASNLRYDAPFEFTPEPVETEYSTALYHREHYDVMRIHMTPYLKETIRTYASQYGMGMTGFIFAALHRVLCLYKDNDVWYRSKLTSEGGVSEEDIIHRVLRVCVLQHLPIEMALDKVGLEGTERARYRRKVVAFVGGE